jgi:enterochelin esterase-like enzyme
VLGAVGDLLIITPQAVTLLAAGGALAVWICVRMVRRHRRLLAAVAGALTLVLVPAAAADAVNAHFQYLPRVADVVDVATWPTARAVPATVTATNRHPHGAVVQLRIAGAVSGFGRRTAFVYLPPQYFEDVDRRFPVIYLLHGSPGAPVDWFRAARAAQAGDAVAQQGWPVILVAPRVSRYWSDDSECVDGVHGRVETYVVRDVVPDIDRTFRTLASRAGRAVVGNSAGGFCALNLGLRHRDVFAGIGDLSGYDHPTYGGGLRRLFGPHHLARTVASEDPSHYLPRLGPGPRVYAYLDVGKGDGEPRRDTTRVQRLLRDKGQVVTLTERPGGHDYGVWRPALLAALRWLVPLLSPPGRLRA